MNMLSQLRTFNTSLNSPVCAEVRPDDRWSRNMQEDMKEAIDLVFKLKASLDKLHPDCLTIIERMISLTPRNY
jgi:hypothetical protein